MIRKVNTKKISTAIAAAMFAASLFGGTRTEAIGQTCEKGVWKVAELNGAPCLFRDGRPVAPMMFWQWEIEEQDAKT